MIKTNTKIEDIKKGQIIWFHETHSNRMESAIVRDTSKTGIILDTAVNGTIYIPVEYAFTDKTIADAALQKFNETSIETMCDKVNSPEDLLRFSHTHNTSREDASEHEKHAARIKAKEISNFDIENNTAKIIDDRYFAVTAINIDTGKFRSLYDFIKNPEDAYLLAQYAIQYDKKTNEVIAIFPGRRVTLTNKLKERAMRLAEKYKED